jgi:hypothetical protein
MASDKSRAYMGAMIAIAFDAGIVAFVAVGFVWALT